MERRRCTSVGLLIQRYPGQEIKNLLFRRYPATSNLHAQSGLNLRLIRLRQGATMFWYTADSLDTTMAAARGGIGRCVQ